jgi:hypothetical protein
MPLQDSDANDTSSMDASNLDDGGAVDSAETIQFLRRLASFISVGENAAKLDYAATLIELLSHRIDETGVLLRERAAKAATLMDMCVSYESLIDQQHIEIQALKTNRERQTQEADVERAELKNKIERLSALAGQMDAERAAAVLEADVLKAKFAAQVDAATVPVTTLLAIRTQFEALSDEFSKKGDLISQVMSHVGRCTIDRAIVDAEPEAIDPLKSSAKTQNESARAA